MALLSEGVEDAQEKILRLVRRARKVGLRVNVKKTQIMRLNCPDDRRVSIDGRELEEVGEFCYLGSLLTPYGGSVEDVANRLRKARGAFESLRGVWSSREISRKTKLVFYCSIVESTLLYGSECWSLTRSLEKHLQVFYLNRILNFDLLETTEQTDIIFKIIDRK